MNYPAGVTQASFDRETERLNEPPHPLYECQDLMDPQTFDRLEMQLHPERFMRRSDAAKITRVVDRIYEIADFRYREGFRTGNALEQDCARAMWRILGGIRYEVFGESRTAEL